MLTELVHQKNCKKNEMITDAYTGEIACSSCGSVSSEPIIDLGSETSLDEIQTIIKIILESVLKDH